jgi:hypothetical protein
MFVITAEEEANSSEAITVNVFSLVMVLTPYVPLYPSVTTPEIETVEKDPYQEVEENRANLAASLNEGVITEQEYEDAVASCFAFFWFTQPP